MRIISGELKGKKIFLPKDKNTRPLRDLVKESIFNLLEHSKKIKIQIEDSVVLDLFSGSGSFGIECISRKAKKVSFIENYSDALKILNKNIFNLNITEKCNVIERDCFEIFDSEKYFSHKFDIIFIDPPYKENKINDLIYTIKNKKILNKDGIIIIHRHKNDNLIITNNLNILDTRKYGISKIIIGN
tara:strand:- start:6706 stop:7266 length:561 start_codon:yes stop_codon:yes gene_type:complete